MAPDVNLSHLTRKKLTVWITVVALAIAVPVAIKLLSLSQIDSNLVMTFFVLLAGCLYELYSPWINKLMKYKRAVEDAMSKGEEPPDVKRYFGFGVKFNKWFYAVTAFSFVVGVAFTFYLLLSRSVVYDNWVANVLVNFAYAVGQTKILKERIM